MISQYIAPDFPPNFRAPKEVEMKHRPELRSYRIRLFALLAALLATVSAAGAQTNPSPETTLYRTLTRFDLNGGTAQAEKAVLKRDRAAITFNGTFYFEAPIEGHIRGAVFIGDGAVHADVPESSFERDNVRRMLHADSVDSTFKTAVLRFSDDTLEALAFRIAPGNAAPADAQKLASDFSPRMLAETGANIPARLLVSILNQENPGVFVAEFDKGSRGRFGLVLDHQCRIPAGNFGLDGGEKGLFFAYDEAIYSDDVWMAFFSLLDYQQGHAEYSDAHAVVNVNRYDMNIDLRDWKHMKLEVRMTMTALSDGVRAVPLIMNEQLGRYDDTRLKKALRLRSAQLAGAPLAAIQEDWDGTLTLLLPAPAKKGDIIQPTLDFEGQFLTGYDNESDQARYVTCDCWYPRHEALNRAAFDVTFEHKKGTVVTSIGEKVRDDRDSSGDMVTEWRMDQPVAITTFALGNFQVFTDKVKMEDGREINLDFYRLPSGFYSGGVKTDFVLAELNNCVRYFSALFGPYPYSRFGATYHPYPFGQGFPTMLMLPKADQSDQSTFSFIAHETSHQWWGDTVMWRSYRDQWLSEGFADYSGVLYAGRRDKDKKTERDLLRIMHDQLLYPPQTLLGTGKGRLVDIGPLILGHRLNTRESYGAYETLIYKKGALVLRMLHFLFSDPSSGDDHAFFDMMKDFVNRYTGRAASTEDFMAVANEHFAGTPIARALQAKNLNWFFQQWVYESELPSYELSYSVEPQADGSSMVHCIVKQSDVPSQWAMLLPVVVRYGKDKFSRGIVVAAGPERAATLHLPQPPESIELDPDHWVLSNKTTTVKGPAKASGR